MFTNVNYGKDAITHTCSRKSGIFGRHKKKCDIINNLPIKSEIKYEIYPQNNWQPTCTLMLLSNLAEPNWISISCFNTRLLHIVCVNNPDQEYQGVSYNQFKNNNNLKTIYSKTCIKIFINCYQFVWDKCKVDKSKQNIIHNKPLGINEVKYLVIIFNAVKMISSFPQICIQTTSKTFIFQFINQEKKMKLTNYSADSSEKGGFYMIHEYGRKFTGSIALCFCKSGQFIMCDFLCDGTIDCPNDGSDEDCVCKKNDLNSNIYFMRTNHGKLKKVSCSSLYYMTKMGTCQKYNSVNLKQDLVSTTPENIQISQEYNTTYPTNYTWIKDDLVPDHSNGNDENILRQILLYDKYVMCSQPSELPCLEGHTKCYNVTDICLYKLDMFLHLVPCRNGAHIQYCKQFQCNMLFKCPNSYCIPWVYVCDGKWDCPLGTDETLNSNCKIKDKCHNMFKCRRTYTCVHLGNVCDKHRDCPFGDDEDFCTIIENTCPFECHCLLFAMSCQNTFISELWISKLNLPVLQLFVLYHSSVSSIQKLFRSMINVLILRLPHNNISNICRISKIGSSLITLDLGFNVIRELKRHCFCNMYQFKSLSVNNNRLEKILSHSLSNLPQFAFMNLSGNYILELSINIFYQLSIIKLMDCSMLLFKEFHVQSFQRVLFKVFLTDDYYVCCLTSSIHICTSPITWHFSCSDILHNVPLKIIFGTISILTCILNSMSIWLHGFTKEREKTFAVIVVFLNLNDFLCGIYLGIIWTMDRRLEGIYFVRDKWWRSSYECYTAFIAVLWLNLLSQLLLISLATSRLMVVIYPMKTKFRRKNFVLKLCIVLFILTFVLCGIILLLYDTFEGILPSRLCLPFIDPIGSMISKVVTWLIATTQSISSVLILFLHVLLFMNIKASQKLFLRSRSKEYSNKSILFQLLSISFSNILCLFPTNSIYIAAMLMTEYPMNLIMWAMVTSLPINSIVNPLIFCTVLIQKKVKSRMC